MFGPVESWFFIIARNPAPVEEQCKRVVVINIRKSEWLKEQVLGFAQQHPHIEIMVTPRPAKHPCVRAFYLNGKDKVICLRNLEPKRIGEYVDLLKDTGGWKVQDWRKVRVKSDTPSVRGIWNPWEGPALKI